MFRGTVGVSEKLKWWFLFCASALAFIGAGVSGLLQGLWQVDQTKLSFVIVAIYFVVSGFVGWLTILAADGRVNDLTQHLNSCDEASDLLMKIAIMGTTLGFYLMLSAPSGPVWLLPQRPSVRPRRDSARSVSSPSSACCVPVCSTCN